MNAYRKNGTYIVVVNSADDVRLAAGKLVRLIPVAFDNAGRTSTGPRYALRVGGLAVELPEATDLKKAGLTDLDPVKDKERIELLNIQPIDTWNTNRHIVQCDDFALFPVYR